MDDTLLRQMKRDRRRLGHAEVIERPGMTATYTPTVVGGSTAGVTTYSLQQGAYTRIGALVLYTLTVVWTNATGTGEARFGLPFTAANVTNQNYAASVRLVNVTFAAGTPQAQIAANTNYMTLISPATNAAGTVVAVETAGNVIASGWFFMDL